MSLKKDLEFIYEIGCLRHVDRTWKQFLGHNFANVTEHTFRVMWLSLLIAKKENADISKTLKIALIHDLSESRTGDVHYLSRQFSQRMDEKAINETLKGTSHEELVELWKEYEERNSLEAKIVKDADNLDVDLELREQCVKGAKIADDWKDCRLTASKTLFTATAREIWKEIQESNPHEWHINGSNRLNKGDWAEHKEKDL